MQRILIAVTIKLLKCIYFVQIQLQAQAKNHNNATSFWAMLKYIQRAYVQTLQMIEKCTGVTPIDFYTPIVMLIRKPQSLATKHGMHIITWVWLAPRVPSMSCQIIISRISFFSKALFCFSCLPQVLEFQLKFLDNLWSQPFWQLVFSQEFFHLALLSSCRHLIFFLSSSFVKRRFSRREHLLHISTIEHRKERKPRDISLGPPSKQQFCPHKRWEPSTLDFSGVVHNNEQKKDDLWLFSFFCSKDKNLHL